MAVTSQIVTVNASVVTAPAVSTLQQMGALVSVGGSTLTTNTYQYCGTLAAVTAILSSSGNYVELTAMATTFFAQGGAVGVYVLEIGAGGGASATQIAALTTWMTNNPNTFYAFLTPATWDTTSSAALNTLAASYSGTTAATYFFATITVANIASYLATSKSLLCTVKSPTAASTEFQAATFFYQALSNNPSISAPLSPLQFRFVFGVTPWALISSGGTSNIATINTILTAYANIIITGAEGGISTAMLTRGTTMDGNQFNFWWAVDWLVINSHVALANAVINGSQPGQQNPLVYNQFGINTLLAVLNNLGATGVSEQIFLTFNFTAVPFITYTTANSANYAAGIYGGFQGSVTPQLGFEAIVFNVAATTFA